MPVTLSFDFDAEMPVPARQQPEDRRPAAPVEATIAPAQASPRAAEVRAGYVEQILRDEQTLRLGLGTHCPNDEFYVERIKSYKELL